MKHNKGKSHVLHLGQGTPSCKDRLRGWRRNERSRERGSGGSDEEQVDYKSTVCAGSQKAQKHPGVHQAYGRIPPSTALSSCQQKNNTPHPGVQQGQHHQIGQGRDCPSLLCSEAASPRVLGAILGTTTLSC